MSWESNQYEVPYDHVTEILPLRITASEVHVYAADLSRVAVHPRLERGARQRARLAGRTLPSSRPRAPTLAQLEPIYHSLGMADFLANLAATQRSGAYHARKILALRDRYATDDLAWALAHAHKYQAFDSSSVERILQSRARPRRLDEYVTERTAEKTGPSRSPEPHRAPLPGRLRRLAPGAFLRARARGTDMPQARPKRPHGPTRITDKLREALRAMNLTRDLDEDALARYLSWARGRESILDRIPTTGPVLRCRQEDRAMHSASHRWQRF